MEGIKAARSYLLAVLGILVGVVLIASPAVAAKKPNILVIWGDDIGWSTLGAYNHSVMKYHTPNIDGTAKDGVLFTDHYAQPSCTAGRQPSSSAGIQSVE